MIREHFWGPYAPALARAEKLAAGCRRTPGAIILEIGPGAIPFSQATHFVDREGSASSPAVERLIAGAAAEEGSADRFLALDMSHEALPFADGEVDFLYARHVLEDLADPLNLLLEIARVAKAGYIETPSPVAELCRGVDGGSPRWRGYHHHRSICWVEADGPEGDQLHLVAKYPIIEHLDLDTVESWVDAGSDNVHPVSLEDRLNRGPLHWNTYVFFDQGLDWKLHEHDVDMKVWDGSYEKLLRRAIAASLERNKRFEKKLTQRAEQLRGMVEGISAGPVAEKGFERVLEAFIPDFVPPPGLVSPPPAATSLCGVLRGPESYQPSCFLRAGHEGHHSWSWVDGKAPPEEDL